MANHEKNLPRRSGAPYPVQSMAAYDWTARYEVSAEDIADSALTGQGDTVTVKIASVPEGFAVKSAALNVVKAFETTGTLKASVGSSADPDGIIAAQDLKTAGIKAPVAGFAPATAAAALAGDVVLQFATQTSTGAPADITAGKLLLLLQVVSIS